MSIQTYWLAAPLFLIGLSGFGWPALWLTRLRKEHNHLPARKLRVEQPDARSFSPASGMRELPGKTALAAS